MALYLAKTQNRLQEGLSLPGTLLDLPARHGPRWILGNLKIKSGTLCRNWNLRIFREPETHTSRPDSWKKYLIVLVGSGSPSGVEMMQPTDLGYLDHLTERRRLGWLTDGGIFIERQMGATALVVLEIVLQDTMQVGLVESEDVVQAFAPNGADQSLDKRVLPRRLWRSEDFVDVHPLRGLTKLFPIRAIAVSQ